MKVSELKAMWEQKKTAQEPKIISKPTTTNKITTDKINPLATTYNHQVPTHSPLVYTHAPIFSNHSNEKINDHQLNKLTVTQLPKKQVIQAVIEKEHHHQLQSIKTVQTIKKDQVPIKHQVKNNLKEVEDKQKTRKQGQEQKIDFKSLKDKFNNLNKPMGLGVPVFQPTFKPMPQKNILNLTSNHAQKKNHQQNHGQITHTQSVNSQNIHVSSYQVEDGTERQLSFQQKRKMAEAMFLQSKFVPKVLDHPKQTQINETTDTYHNLQHKSDEKIHLKQQTYHFNQTSEQKKKAQSIEQKQKHKTQKDEQSDKIFSQVLRGLNDKIPNLLGNEDLTLNTRMTRAKKKRTDKQEFDEM